MTQYRSDDKKVKQDKILINILKQLPHQMFFVMNIKKGVKTCINSACKWLFYQ